MKKLRACFMVLALTALSACASPGAITGLDGDISTGRTLGQSSDDLPVTITDFRGERIERFSKHIGTMETFYRSCPPGTESCRLALPAGGRPALRGSTPWMAQITLPERWVSDELGPIAPDNWQERHFCGGALIAPGWVVTAAHCVDNDMIAQGWRVRVGMTNLALADGRYYTIDRIVCFDPANCRYPRRDPLYRDDIALVHFTAAPGDLVPARDPAAFVNIGVEALGLAEGEGRLTTWSEDGTQREWDIASGAELARSERTAGELLPFPALAAGTLANEPTRNRANREVRFASRTARLSWDIPPEGDGAFAFDLLRLDTETADGRAQQVQLLTGFINELRLAPDESYFVTSTGRECPCKVTAHDSATLRELWSVTLDPPSSIYDFTRHGGEPQILEVSERGVLVSNSDEVLVIDPASGAFGQRFTHPRSPSWQSQNGGPPDEGQRNFVSYAGLSADGRTLTTATNRYGESDIWLWDTAAATVQQRIPQDDPLLSEVLEGAVLVQGGTRVFSWTGYGTYRLWDADSGAQLSIMRQRLPMRHASLLRQGTIAAIFDEAGVSNWQLDNGAEISRFDHLRFQHGGTVSPDETRELTWSEDGTARVWDIGSAAEVRRVYHNGEVNGAAFMADPARVLSWSDDGTARITNVSDGAIPMIYDHGQYPPGSPLALPISQRAAPGVEVSYLPLASADGPPLAGSDVEIYGWGKTQAPGGFDPYASLLTVDLTVLDNPACSDLPGMEGRQRVHPRVFCARDEYEKTCKGDSGGPVVQHGMLVGIVSWGKKDCTYDGQPGVYTRIAAYADWIAQQVGAANLPLPLAN